jgi:hypothetical protein
VTGFNGVSARACAAADTAVVLLFIAVGRFAHSEPLTASGIAATGWPFAVGLVGGYIGVLIARARAISIGGGLVVSLKTVLLAMILRAGVQQDDTPWSFVLVTTVLLVGLMLGWRAVVLYRLAGGLGSFRTAQPRQTSPR